MGKNMETGGTLNKAYKFQKNISPKRWKHYEARRIVDPFFDSYEDEMLTCCGILDEVDLTNKNSFTVKFDKNFLRAMVKSHMKNIRQMNEIK